MSRPHLFGEVRTVGSLTAHLDKPRKAAIAGHVYCYRRACQVELDDPLNMWFNDSTRQWYCQKCAIMINQWNPGLCKRLQHPSLALVIDEKAGEELTN